MRKSLVLVGFFLMDACNRFAPLQAELMDSFSLCVEAKIGFVVVDLAAFFLAFLEILYEGSQKR